MMRAQSQSGVVSAVIKPLCILVLVAGLFSLVWLRANVVSNAYAIRALEEKKIAALKDLKMLSAERSKMMSLASVGASGVQSPKAAPHPSKGEFVFPDRVKVYHVTEEGASATKKVSAQEGRRP